MKAFGYTVLGILVLLVLIAGSVVMGILGKGCDTASKMADQTIFNADKHVWTYEEFYNKSEAYAQHKANYDAAKKGLAALKASGTKSDDPEYDNLVMQKTGSYQMANQVAKDYNKMADVAYQKIWRDKNLPEKLEMLEP